MSTKDMKEEKKTPWWRPLSIGLAVVAVFTLGFFVINAARSSAAAGNGGKELVVDGVLESEKVDVSSKIPGRLSELLVKEGDTVNAGQLLATIEANELDAKHDQAVAGVNAAETQVAQGNMAVELENRKGNDQIEQAKAGVDAADAALGMAQQKLAALESGARPQEIAQAEQAVAAAQAAYDTAEKTSGRITRLADEGVVSRQKADEVEMAFHSAKANLTAQQAKLDLVREGVRPEEREAARQQVKQAEAGVAAARQTLQLARDGKMMVGIRSKDVDAARQKVAASQGQVREVAAYQNQTQIVAPISGRITQRMSKGGEIVASGYAILTIARTEDYHVNVNVDESKFAGRKVGDAVTVEIPALGRSVRGKISALLPAADFGTRRATNEKGTFDVRAVQLRVTLEENVAELANGVTARVHFAPVGR